jgi:hypothetical protein
MLLRKKSVAAMKVNNDCWSDFERKARARPLDLRQTVDACATCVPARLRGAGSASKARVSDAL